MKRIGLYSLLLLLSLTGFSQTQLSRGSFSNGANINGSSASYQLKSSVNGIGFRTTAVEATGVVAGDSLALVEIYNANGGTSWTNTTNWLAGNVDTWHGITITADRVTGIHLNSNNLTGDLPAQIGDLTALDTLNLDANFLVSAPPEMNLLANLLFLDIGRNRLETLPDISALISTQTANFNYGFLDFDDILPNVNVPNIFFGSQNIINTGYDSLVNVGDTIVIDLTGTIAGAGNVYQWDKDGVDIPGATSEILTISNFQLTANGAYRLRVTNPSDITGTVIYSYNYNLNSPSTMYWIGDGGDWKDITNWSYTSGTVDPVATLPGRYDDVVFDANSFTLPGQIVTILDDTTTVGAEFRNMDWTGVLNSPTFQVKTTVSDWIYSWVYGSLIFDQNMALDFRGAEFYFTGDQDYVIDTKGHYLGDNCWLAINYGGNSKPVVCDVISDINPAGIYLNQGRMNTNGNNIYEKDSYVWVRGDSSTLDITGSYLEVSNFTLNSSTLGATVITDNSTINVSTKLQTFGVSYNHVILSDTARVAQNGNNYNILEVAPGANVKFESELIQSANSFIANGTVDMPISISATKLDTAAVLNVSSGIVNVNHVTLKNNEATGGAIFNAYNSLDSGNVVGWNFIANTPGALYWVGDGGDWNDLSHWSTTSGGAADAPLLPDHKSAVIFDPNSFTSAGQVVVVPDDGTTTGVQFQSMDWTGVTNNPTFQIRASTSQWISSSASGSVIFDPNMIVDFFHAEFYFNSPVDYVFDTKGHDIGEQFFLALGYDAFGLDTVEYTTTCNANSDLLSDPYIYIKNGSMNMNGNNITNSKNAYLWLAGQNTSLNISGSTIQVGDLNSIQTGSSIIDDGAIIHINKRLLTNGYNFNHVILSDTVTIQNFGNQYDTLEILPGANVRLASEMTQTVGNLIMNGSSSMPITLTATKLDTAAVISQLMGEVNANYVSFKDNTVTGGATFNAYNSLDNGNVTGWNFLLNNLLFEQDSLALVAFYNNTNGATWTNKANWLTGTPDTWFGLTIADSRVVDLSLPGNNLSGKLPLELKNLTQLESLQLHDNVITDTVPASLLSLPNLSYLSMHTNQLSGALPNNIGTTGKYTFLELSNNNFEGDIPSTIGNNTALNYLNLSNNNFSGVVPSTIQNLANIQTLYLDNNALIDLPDLSGLSSIATLGLTYNYFTFEDLEANSGITGVDYSSMKSTSIYIDTLMNVSDTIVFTANIGGSANSYKWLKNDVEIVGETSSSHTKNTLTFANEGVFISEVTNSLVPGLILRSDTFNLVISSIERDKLALEAIYNATGGSGWSGATNWLSADLTTWEGVTVAGNRVTDLDLSNKNLIGEMPLDLSYIRPLITVNLSGNSLTKLPRLTRLVNITSMDVSSNKLEFGSLEPNVGLTGINYANQDSIGVGGEILVNVDTDHTFEIVTSGTANNYQWFKDDVAIADSTATATTVPTIRRAEMGEYYVQVTNNKVPGLTLTSKTSQLLAQTNISGTITLDGTAPMTSGEITLLKVTNTDGYDTTSIIAVGNDGTYTHSGIILDDYIAIVQPDTIAHTSYLPTYYSSTIFWEEADTIYLDSMMINFNFMLQGGPVEAPSGEGKIVGVLEEEVPDGGRIEAKRKVAGAGVSVRRRAKQGKTEEDEYILVAYVYSDENGEFGFYNLEPDEYLVNVQYPGYPMDETSTLFIPVGTDNESDVQIAALVDQGKIAVTIIEVTGTVRAKFYESVEIYPNPATEKVFLRGLPQEQSYSAFVMDITGRTVLSFNEVNDGLNVSSLENGVYILNVITEDSSKPILSARITIRKR